MKYIYTFNEGSKDMVDVLGIKGANLAHMSNLGLPVPYGIILTTDFCKNYYYNDMNLTVEMKEEINQSIKCLETATNKEFGGFSKPLLISVRSSFIPSVSSMMDSVLNLGMNDDIVSSLVNASSDPRYIYDCYRKFILMYSKVVKNISEEKFNLVLGKYKEFENIDNYNELSSDSLKQIVEDYKGVYLDEVGTNFPSDIYEQLYTTIEAIFNLFNSTNSITYRKLNNVNEALFSAINIEEMVYGNFSDTSLTGVAFSRHPKTGEDTLYGEYLNKAQGCDLYLTDSKSKSIEELKNKDEKIYLELCDYVKKLEKEFKDVQEINWTIENGKLYLLETKVAKLEAKAALMVGLEFLENEMIDEKEFINRLTINDMRCLVHPSFNPSKLSIETPIAKGLNGAMGACVGKIYFSSKAVIEAHHSGEENIILVRDETSAEDIEAMKFCRGILTTKGAMTSHAAVIARGLGKVCVCSANGISINFYKKIMYINNEMFIEGDYISLNGDTGDVYKGVIQLIKEEVDTNVEKLIAILNKYNKLEVRANVDTPSDAKRALEFGCSGIGLCRTEHMFFDKNRIFEVRKMILADSDEDRKVALDNLLVVQTDDFYEMFKVMNQKKVTIRYLDPPLHEFLPNSEDQLTKLANSLNIPVGVLRRRKNQLKEVNPMIGHRGCRLLISYPEIIRMQTNAIFEAAIKASKEDIYVEPELMIPLISDVNEYEYIVDVILDTINEIFKKYEIIVKYKIGTMIETPRACLVSSKLARMSDFFSFGTNDLTQLTYGFSRDDSAKFLNNYIENDILEVDPFVSLDRNGVGKLLAISIIDARNNNEKITLGLCGEHASDYNSISLCYDLGLDYVSCSTYSILTAKLVSAKKEIS